MTTNVKQATAAGRSKALKFAKQMAIGSIIGGGTTYAVLTLIDDRVALFDDPQRMIALVAGLVFAMMALFVGFGVAAPDPGSKLLNVEDAEELRERRPELGIGVILIALTAAILILLSVTSIDGSPGLISERVSTVSVMLCFVALAIGGFLARNQGDELDKLLGVESASLAMSLSLTFFGGWGILSYLGHVPWIGPLGLFAGLLITYLAAIFWVIGRRGLMNR